MNWYEVPVLTRIEAPNAHAAHSRVHEILTLADSGHELYEISGTWTTGTATELPYKGRGPSAGQDDRQRARSHRTQGARRIIT